ncbi:MAG: DNA polymerase/3'-5' exonuclease PolX [Nitrospiraceae bacterium]|nr:DNA polymerase/3'-5' exonuclease PolX [Nitrospiraceae bacterium]
MRNQDIARIFTEIADMLEIKDENPFRVRAYRRAAMAIGGFPRDASGMSREELRKIPGIGEDLAMKIREIADTGTCKFYDDLKKKSPAGLTQLLTIPGLGPKTAKFLYSEFNVRTVEELEKLVREHRLKGLRGFKEKSERNILRGIELMKKGTDRVPLGRILPVAQRLMEGLREKKAPVKNLAIAGSLRRWKETIRDIDLLATSADPAKVMEVFTGLPEVKQVLAKGGTKTTVILEEGIQADLRVVEEDSFGAALCYFTGSKEHNIRLREMAVKRGLKINEYGVFDQNGKKTGGKREEDVYNILGLPFIPPEMREDSGEIEAALEGRLPRVVQLSDIRGDLHVHSKWSDGGHTFEELADTAIKHGYSYLAVTDHSKGLGIARGLTVERMLEEIKLLDALNRKLKGTVRILKGVEVDIRSDYTLDFPDELLARLDVVNASIHTGFRQSSAQITKRIVSAMRNPFVNIISHPTGRLIGEREAYELDMDDVFREAKETGTALEINSFPARLDLNDSMARRAKEKGISIAISTDAHLLSHFDYMAYGVATARRAWLEPGEVINTMGVEELLKTLRKKRMVLAGTGPAPEN